MGNKTVFSIYSNTIPDMVNFQTPLQISYLMSENNVIDITSGEKYPFLFMYQNYLHNILVKIKDLYNKNSNIEVFQEWDREKWYATNSLVYFYDEYLNKYIFYKSINMTNLLINPLKDHNYWNEYNSQKWYEDDSLDISYNYTKDTIVHLFIDGKHEFYECINDTTGVNYVDNEEFWQKVNVELWSSNNKYNIGTRVYLDNTIYTAIKTVLPYSDINDTRYWTRSFNTYGILKILESIKSVEIDQFVIQEIEALENIILSENGIMERLDYILNKFNMVNNEDNAEDIEMIYDDILSNINIFYDLHEDLFNKFNDIEDLNLDNFLIKTLWKNIFELKKYIETTKQLRDPINILNSIKNLESFKSRINSENKNIMVYVKDMYDTQDPHQKYGAYFIYNPVVDRFIKHLVGTEIYKNKQMLDEIANAYDDISEKDTSSYKFLTIRKEKNKNTNSDMAWDFKAQWKDVDLIPDKPNDNKEYLLKTNKEGELEWTDKFTSNITFVKKELKVTNTSNRVYIEDVDITYDKDGTPLDTVLLFRNSLFSNDFSWVHDNNSKTLEISVSGGDSFDDEDLLTILVIRNTSAEMLYKLSNEYVSKKEAIDILSNGRISLLDYVRKDDLYKYTLRNHIHTNYANRIHTHDGIYAYYNHDHDNYTTREDVDKMIGDILSVNPELVNIISQIASDAEQLENVFVTKNENVEIINRIENRLDNLELIEESSIYMKIFEDENSNLISQLVRVGEGNIFEPVNIDSLQIVTKYKKTDDPMETELYNLEEWLDYILDRINVEDQRIKTSINTILKSGKYPKTLVYEPGVEENIDISSLLVNKITIMINQEFDYPFSIRMGDIYNQEILIPEDQIFEKEVSITEYLLNKVINDNVGLWVDRDPEEENGQCSIIITGYEI